MSHDTNATAREPGTVPHAEQADRTAPAAHAPYARRWAMLPVLLAALFMTQFDLYVVNVTAPSLAHDLGAGEAALELIVAGYGFSYASGLITGGRLGDLLGPRTVFLAGVLAFTVASLLCGLAPTPGWLVAARLLQGLAGAAMVPQVLALITAAFPAAERARALAWFGVTLGVGAVAGQVLGGALLQVDVLGLGWRVIFLVNVPLGLAALAFAPRLLPALRPGSRPGLDPLGAAGVSGSLALVLVPLAMGRGEGWPVWCWVCLAAAAPAMALTLRWERGVARRGGQPLLEPSLLRNGVFVRGLLVCLGTFCSFFSFMFALTMVLQSGLGLSPLAAGATFTPLGVAFAGASIASPRLAGRYGARLVTGGTAIACTGMLALFFVLQLSGEQTSVGRLLAPMVLIGFGNGMAVPALTGVVLAGIGTGQAGAAAGVLTTSQQFSSAVGVAGVGTLFFAALGSRHGVGGYADALQWVAVSGFCLALLACAASLLLPSPVKEKAT
ncbi:MFS transporter [Streptomyces boninensis]|uniref:MFS transporter n=1 Tax=Streptomyces boninensis TaxID=2039455 RepID=UPI003B215475